MSLRTTFILMVVFMGLGSIAFFDPFKVQEKKNLAAETEKQVFPLKDKKLEWMELKRGGSVVRLECAASAGCPFDGSANWKITQPLEDSADSSTVGTLAGAFLNLSFQERVDFETPVNGAEFGFNEASPAVQFKTKEDATPFSFEIGGKTAIGPNFYLRRAGVEKTLFVVAAYFPQMLEKDLFHWRNKRLFPNAAVEKISALNWQSKTKFAAVKNGPSWALTQPVEAPANLVMMEGLVSTLVHASAKSIFAESRAIPAAKKLLKATPDLTAEFAGSDTKQKVSFYLNGKELIAAVEGGLSLLSLDAVLLERFKKPVLEYRDRRIFPQRDRNSVDEISLTFPRDNKSVGLKLSNGIWEMVGESPAEPLSQNRIEAIVAALTEAEAKEFLPASSPSGKAYSSGPKDVEVVLKGANLPEDMASFVVAERRLAVTAGNGKKPEVRVYGEDLLKALPIRVTDLLESNNKLVPEVKPLENEMGEHGNDHSGHRH